jgi:hypothetical protein
MNSSLVLPAVKSSHTLQGCKDFAVSLLAQIEQDEKSLKELEKVNKYTPEIKREIKRLKENIADNHKRLGDTKAMLELPVGSWVKNGSTRPGKITELKIVGKIPEVHVLWWGNTATIPERPTQLKLIEPSDLEYIWNGDRIPKLVRKIDHWECDEPEIIQDFLKRAKTCKEISEVNSSDEIVETYTQQINYLSKRLKWLARPQTIPIESIKRDRATQQRTSLNHEIVIEYAEAMKNGDRFPPVKVRYDDRNYWLTDGFHTTEAAWSIGKTEIQAVITKGTLRDAILDSVGVNAEHGLRRSNADKRRAVTTLLEDEEWGKWSNCEIARRCKVSEGLVRKVKDEISPRIYEVTKCTNDSTSYIRSDNPKSDNQIITGNVSSDNHKNYIDKYGNVSQMNTASIGSDNTRELLTNNAENINKDESQGIQIASGGFPDGVSSSTGNKKLVEQFEIGQLVKIQLANFKGVSEQLKLANHSYGMITEITSSGCSLNVAVDEHKSFILSPQDIQEVKSVSLTIDLSPKEYIAALSIFKNKDAIKEALKHFLLNQIADESRKPY